MDESKNYEYYFNVLKSIADELKAGNLGIDELVKKGKEASEAAKICLDILKTEKGNFTSIEEELDKISKNVDTLINGDNN